MVAHNHNHHRHARAAVLEAEVHADAVAPRALSTIVSVVYVTASPTFTGAIGGYTTLGVAIDTEASSTPTAVVQKETSSSQAAVVADTSKAESQTTLATSATSKSALPSSIVSPTGTFASSAAVLVATNVASSTTTAATSGTLAASSATSTATSDSTSSGISAAGEAGLAIGILLLVGAILAMVLFCFKRKREQRGQKLEDEKVDLIAMTNARQMDRYNTTGSNMTTRTQATAPRLSLRPVTQFLPNLIEKRTSKGNLLTAGNANNQNDKANPFGNHTEKVLPANPQDNPFGNHAETIDATNARGPGLVHGITPNGDVILAENISTVDAAVTPVGLKRGDSKKDVASKGLDFTKAGPFMGPPSPSGTEFSMTSDSGNGTPVQTATSVAIAAAGYPANSGVHRVQLDFVPSMADELELKAGQLVRVLHEFDDGWAMCIRLDRSQQGVCPRTCLSARPVKPRPNNPRGPPPGMRVPGPQGRPMQNSQGRPTGPPQGQSPRPTGLPKSPRPMAPNDGRPMTPQGLQPRPRTPQGPAGPLPGTPQQRPRSNSAALPQSQSRIPQPRRPTLQGPASSPMKTTMVMVEGAQFNMPVPGSSPPTQSPIGRKPVPGQAL